MAVIGYYGNDNAGDEALLQSVLAHLRTWTGKVSELLVLSSKPELTERLHGIPAVENLFPETLKDVFIRVFGRNRRNFFNAMRRALACDTLVVGGGGLFFDRRDSNIDFLRFMWVIRLFQMLGKDVFLIGVSSLPLHHAQSRRVFARIARHPRTRAIICRDHETAAQFRAAKGNDQNVFVTEDIVFALPAPTVLDPVVTKYLDGKGPQVALALCGPELDAQPSYRILMGDVVRRLVARGIRVLLVPMSVGLPNDRAGMRDALVRGDFTDLRTGAFSGRGDRTGMRDAFGTDVSGGVVRLVEENLSVEQNMQLLGAVNCVVAERLHASILALVAGAPVVGISYSPKVSLLYERLGRPDWCRDKRSLDANWIEQQVVSALQDQRTRLAEIAALRGRLAMDAEESFKILERYF